MRMGRNAAGVYQEKMAELAKDGPLISLAF